MGIFSFLTGGRSTDREEARETGRTDESPRTTRSETQSGQAPDSPAPSAQRPAPSSQSPASDLPRPPLGEGPLDQPFTPPEAWNIDALTQPPPAGSGEEPKVGEPDSAQTAALQGKIIEVIKTVFDPEIPVDIYELGLIYDIVVDAERNVLVKMTLTSPACPSAQQLPSEVRYKVKAIPEVTDAWVEIVWEPMWTKDRMSEAARMALGLF